VSCSSRASRPTSRPTASSDSSRFTGASVIHRPMTYCIRHNAQRSPVARRWLPSIFAVCVGPHLRRDWRTSAPGLAHTMRAVGGHVMRINAGPDHLALVSHQCPSCMRGGACR
jgi:hypothetical protein